MLIESELLLDYVEKNIKSSEDALKHTTTQYKIAVDSIVAALNAYKDVRMMVLRMEWDAKQGE